jgi:uncharacterized protein
MADNPFVHCELETTDLPKAKEFYTKLFDWDLDDSAMEGYTLIGVGEHEYGVGGGMMTVPSPGMPSFWLPYVSVDDIEASTEKARALGATILIEVTPVGTAGKMSVIKDPTGATLGLWKAQRES